MADSPITPILSQPNRQFIYQDQGTLTAYGGSPKGEREFSGDTPDPGKGLPPSALPLLAREEFLGTPHISTEGVISALAFCQVWRCPLLWLAISQVRKQATTFILGDL
jgi:hypothetical protein